MPFRLGIPELIIILFICAGPIALIVVLVSVFGKKKKDGLAIASMILGIISLGAWLFPICGFQISTTGLVLGIVGRNSSKQGMAIAGIVMCIIGLIITIVNSAMGAFMGVTGYY